MSFALVLTMNKRHVDVGVGIVALCNLGHQS